MTIDLITKLLVSSDVVIETKFNTILVIVHKLTKYTEIILFKKKFIAIVLGHILLDKLIKNYRIIVLITSERDKIFTLAY